MQGYVGYQCHSPTNVASSMSSRVFLFYGRDLSIGMASGVDKNVPCTQSSLLVFFELY